MRPGGGPGPGRQKQPVRLHPYIYRELQFLSKRGRPLSRPVVAGGGGFEPPSATPKAAVLPLDDPPGIWAGRGREVPQVRLGVPP